MKRVLFTGRTRLFKDGISKKMRKIKDGMGKSAVISNKMRKQILDIMRMTLDQDSYE